MAPRTRKASQAGKKKKKAAAKKPAAKKTPPRQKKRAAAGGAGGEPSTGRSVKELNELAKREEIALDLIVDALDLREEDPRLTKRLADDMDQNGWRSNSVVTVRPLYPGEDLYSERITRYRRLDGQHRCSAAVQCGITHAHCSIMPDDMTLAEEWRVASGAKS